MVVRQVTSNQTRISPSSQGFVKSTHTFYDCRNNQHCLDECATRGQDYFWCNIAGATWDYCSPAPPSTTAPPMTREGRRCMGVCDFYSSSYQYCPGLYEDRGSWWHYCGVGSSDTLDPGTVIKILVLKFCIWNLT